MSIKGMQGATARQGAVRSKRKKRRRRRRRRSCDTLKCFHNVEEISILKNLL